MANTAKARSLGAELRELRQKAKLSVRALENQLDFSRSTVSRIERGEKVPAADEIGALLAIYGVDRARRAELLEMAEDASQPNWTEVGHPGIPRQLSALIEFENEATRISMVALNRIPGILQTRDYAQALLRAGGIPEQEVGALTTIRLGRQEILTRDKPVELSVLLDEGVLCRPIGGRTTMLEQLNKVLKTSTAENATVQVIPFSLGAHIGLDGSHVLYEFAKASPIVYLEHRRSGQFLDERKDTADFCDLTDKLRAQALNASESAELISAYAAELEES